MSSGTEAPTTQIDITTPEGMKFIRDLMISAQGGDPQARQTLNDFMSFDSNIEKTNLPTRKDVQRVAYFLYVGMSLFPNTKNDPFTDAAEVIATSSMAKGGEKSKQFVELFRRSPDLAALKQTLGESKEPGGLRRFFGGGSKE